MYKLSKFDSNAPFMYDSINQRAVTLYKYHRKHCSKTKSFYFQYPNLCLKKQLFKFKHKKHFYNYFYNSNRKAPKIYDTLIKKNLK